MLPTTEWLDAAKRLAVGMRHRVLHRGERRPNLIIANEPDRYWAYCQACKEGGIKLKEHVQLGANIQHSTVDLCEPDDKMPVLGSEEEIPIARFLATKGMDFMYLPPVWYSKRTGRILLHALEHGWLGRDVTGRSPAKWLAYSKPKFLGHASATRIAVVTEDAFSWYKVAYALRDEPIDVICALGTGITDALVLELIRGRAAVFMFDGDRAGWDGAAEGVQRMRGMGIPSCARCAPDGKDPKDLSCGDIRLLLGGALK